MSEELLIDKQDYVVTISINRPERRNALTYELLAELKSALDSIEVNQETRAVVLRGAGETAFCAGMDLKSNSERKVTLVDVTERIQSLRCPVIAMIHGYALGAGCDIAVSCDLRVASTSAVIGINPVKLGYVHPYRSIQRFLNLMGTGSTKELFLTGRFVEAKKAYEMGLINYMIPKEELQSFTANLAREIAEENAPFAVMATKKIIMKLSGATKLSSEDAAAMEGLMTTSWQTEDVKEGRRAFAEKRKPKFIGK